MLIVLLFHTNIHGGDGIQETLTAQARGVELTHVRNVTGFLSGIDFRARLVDPRDSAAYVLRSVQVAGKAFRVG
jgi:hypothetical protein